MKYRWTIKELGTLTDTEILVRLINERKSTLTNSNAPLYQRLCKLEQAAEKRGQFIDTISRMKTEEEFGDEPPASEDWICTLNALIEDARKFGDDGTREDWE